MEEVISAQVEGSGGFLPALTQIGNVAGLPGVVGKSVALPDAHSGYGFAIGNVAAIDMSHPSAVVSPGGVGFDINCGVRLLRSNLTEDQVAPGIEQLATRLFESIPVGVGARGAIHLTFEDLDHVLNEGMEWLLQRGVSWPEDLELCEENGRMSNADSTVVSKRAKRSPPLHPFSSSLLSISSLHLFSLSLLFISSLHLFYPSLHFISSISSLHLFSSSLLLIPSLHLFSQAHQTSHQKKSRIGTSRKSWKRKSLRRDSGRRRGL